ncbi:MAG TPA: hypothetical protein VHG09_12910 [Longimicrobiales bacterium]|nr:hypothetical protein [Longimicrobiales bacterium]
MFRRIDDAVRIIACSVILSACASDEPQPAGDTAAADARADTTMTPMAEQYVKLVLAVGEHDEGYVDAYYGPSEWREEVAAEQPPLDSISARAQRLQSELAAVEVGDASELVQLRRSYLVRQLEALAAYVRMLQGERLSFDEESQALYDATAPSYDEAHFRSLLDSLESVLPGSGPIPARLEEYKRDFIIPTERLDTVFKAAIAEARRRTAANVELPANESFTLEYVTDKPWSGYNWYQGGNSSLIQINTDLPIFIDRAIDLGAHEGYPGHHVYNVLLEQNLVRERGWPEYSVYPLFSPQSLIAEGSANYGIAVAFPGEERVAFERDVLYPLAGIDPSRAEEYDRVRSLVDRLSYAGNEAARAYLNGDISADSAATWLNAYALMEPARAEQRVRFFDTYRSYVINYNYGRDLVGEYVESRGGTADDPARRWEVFKELLSTPRLPSGLQ